MDADASSSTFGKSLAAWWRPAGVIGLALVAVACGLPRLSAPWIQGDEQFFIAKNSLVTGADGRPLGERLWRLVAAPHDDLYQPLPMVTYALEWALWGEGRVGWMRLTDVLLHAANALLVWSVVAGLLRAGAASAPAEMRPSESDRRRDGLIGLAAAGVWAAHPMFFTVYAADMGRTHLLSCLCFLGAVRLHLYVLRDGSRAAVWPGVAALGLLTLAMLAKPVIGAFAVLAGVEWVVRGWRAALRSWVVWAAMGLGVAFGGLTLWTTQQVNILEGEQLPLFGDRYARTAYALLLTMRDLLLPLGWLSTWYPPEVRTSWSYGPVIGGAAIAAGLMVLAVVAAVRREWRLAAVGLLWFFVTWLPASGLVSARALAIQDRYAYVPVIGLLVAGGWVLVRGMRFAVVRRAAPVLGFAAMVFVVISVPRAGALTAIARSTVDRAEQAVAQNPDDPRAVEMLAIAYYFASVNPSPADQAGTPEEFWGRVGPTLARAVELAEQRPYYYRDDHHRAALHRRISFQYWGLGEAELSLAQARRAYELDPDHPLTWLRLAHAQRLLGRMQEALVSYQELEKWLGPHAPDRALRLTEHGQLLVTAFDEYGAAIEKFREALVTPGISEEARDVATLGLARAEIMAGRGDVGLRLASDVLAANPDSVEARVLIGLYYLRSHKFEESFAVLAEVLIEAPVHYEALRLFHEASGQLGRWQAAVNAWGQAAQIRPNDRPFASFFAWALACGNAPAAEPAATALLEVDPGNPLAAGARMLGAIRAKNAAEAVRWAREVAAGPAIVEARAPLRVEATVRMLASRGELPATALLARAALLAALGNAEGAAALWDEALQTQELEGERELIATLRSASSSASP